MHRLPPLALILGLLLCSCTPRPAGRGNAPSATPSDDTTAAASDTTAVADSSAHPLPPPPPPGNTPAPGSARVEATASSCKARTGGDVYHCALRIEQVDAYGSATPRIGEGQVLHARLLQRTLDQADAQTRTALLDGTAGVELTLRHTGERPAGSSSEGPEWNVVRIH